LPFFFILAIAAVVSGDYSDYSDYGASVSFPDVAKSSEYARGDNLRLDPNT